jgi:hypothetical protein
VTGGKRAGGKEAWKGAGEAGETRVQGCEEGREAREDVDALSWRRSYRGLRALTAGRFVRVTLAPCWPVILASCHGDTAIQAIPAGLGQSRHGTADAMLRAPCRSRYQGRRQRKERPMTRIRILSVDAWRDAEGGWSWNDWRVLAEASTHPETGRIDLPIGFKAMDDSAWDAGRKAAASRRFLRALREGGFLGPGSKGRVSLDNNLADPLTISVQDRANGRPFLAVEISEGE